VQRDAGEIRPAESTETPDAGYPTRRFAPSLNSVTEGGSVFGDLVANERAKQGLSQRELAAKMHINPSTVARIEQGHPPSAELRELLGKTLYPEDSNRLVRALAATGAVLRAAATRAVRGLASICAVAIMALTGAAHRVATWVAPGDGKRRLPKLAIGKPRLPKLAIGKPRLPKLAIGKPRLPKLPLGSHRLWSALVACTVILLAPIIGGWMSSDDSGTRSLQPSVLQVSNVFGAPAAIHRARVAQRAAATKARKAAERERARAAAAAAAQRKAAKTAHHSTLVETQPVGPPVALSPSPSPSGGGGGGGGSSGPDPELQHGIGSGGGGQPPSSGTGSGSSSPPSGGGSKGCALPGILC
jgi:transcriptional regulator with XRE-family HTH domain